MIRDADEDEDGEINFAEFLKIMAFKMKYQHISIFLSKPLPL